jgi:hypothetical protein
MKKIIVFALGTLLMLNTTSCNTYSSLDSATSISQLAGNTFVQNIAKRLMKDLGNMLVQQGISKALGSFNLKTPLSNILTTSQAVSGFKGLLSNSYKVPTNIVENNYNKFSDLSNVVGFLANNSGIKF